MNAFVQLKNMLSFSRNNVVSKQYGIFNGFEPFTITEDEDDDKFCIFVETPGIRKESISIDVLNDDLMLAINQSEEFAATKPTAKKSSKKSTVTAQETSSGDNVSTDAKENTEGNTNEDSAGDISITKTKADTKFCAVASFLRQYKNISFRKRFTFSNLSVADVSATYSDGLLIITVKKDKEMIKAKKITID